MSEEEQVQEEPKPQYTRNRIIVTENKVITSNGVTTLSCLDLFNQQIIGVKEEITSGYVITKYSDSGDSVSFFANLNPNLMEANTVSIIEGLFANAEIKLQQLK